MFFKRKVLEALELNNARLRSIDLELQGIRHAILHQTKLMAQNKKAPKEAAPAPKEITWQEAVQTLCMYCTNRECKSCEAKHWCDKERNIIPACWCTPHAKEEVPADE